LLRNSPVDFNPREGVVLHSVAAGSFAGLVLGIGELMIALVSGRSLLEPVLVTSSLVLGPGALDRTVPGSGSIVAGSVAHFLLSILFAFLFFLLVGPRWRSGANDYLVFVFGITYGALIWSVNLLLVAPLFFPRFTSLHQGWGGMSAYAFLYGAVLGLYAVAVPSAREPIFVPKPLQNRHETVT